MEQMMRLRAELGCIALFVRVRVRVRVRVMMVMVDGADDGGDDATSVCA